MRILNLYLSKNVDKDVIGQNGKKQFNQHLIHLLSVSFFEQLSKRLVMLNK